MQSSSARLGRDLRSRALGWVSRCAPVDVLQTDRTVYAPIVAGGKVPDSVLAAVSELADADERALYEQLGLRSQLVGDDLAVSAEVAPGLREIDELVSSDDLR